MSSKNNSNGGGTGASKNSGGNSGQENSGKSTQSGGGQRTTSGWHAGYERAYSDAINGVNNGETWGGSGRFGQGYMRGHQETYGDKGA